MASGRVSLFELWKSDATAGGFTQISWTTGATIAVVLGSANVMAVVIHAAVITSCAADHVIPAGADVITDRVCARGRDRKSAQQSSQREDTAE